MRRSIRNFNIPLKGNPRAFELLKVASFKFPPLGGKSRSNAPPISTEDKFRLQSNTAHTFQKEIPVCRDDTFKLLLRTLLKEVFTNKGEILSCKSVKPCKTRKNSREYYARTRDKSGSNSPPFQGNVQIPPFPGTLHIQMPGVCPGGNVEVSNRSAHMQAPMQSFLGEEDNKTPLKTTVWKANN